MKRMFSILVIALLFASCGVQPVKLSKTYVGDFFTIKYPEDAKITKTENGISVDKPYEIKMSACTNDYTIKLGDVEIITKLFKGHDNLVDFAVVTMFSDYKAVIVKDKNSDGVVIFIPIDGAVIQFCVADYRSGSISKNIAQTFKITKPDYFKEDLTDHGNWGCSFLDAVILVDTPLDYPIEQADFEKFSHNMLSRVWFYLRLTNPEITKNTDESSDFPNMLGDYYESKGFSFVVPEVCRVEYDKENSVWFVYGTEDEYEDVEIMFQVEEIDETAEQTARGMIEGFEDIKIPPTVVEVEMSGIKFWKTSYTSTDEDERVFLVAKGAKYTTVIDYYPNRKNESKVLDMILETLAIK